MISIVCMYNDKIALEDNLLRTLKNQRFQDYETILVDTKFHSFHSAAEALNYGGKHATGELIMFIHQDVRLEMDDVLDRILAYSSQEEFGIAGVAGIGKNLESFSVIVHGRQKEKAAQNTDFSAPVEGISLDECLLIIPKFVFNQYQYANLGETWHLYGTDYCLQMLEQGMKILILPIEVWHLSEGNSLNTNYYDTIKKLATRHTSFDYIYTLFGKWPTNRYKLSLKTMYRKFRHIVLGR